MKIIQTMKEQWEIIVLFLIIISLMLIALYSLSRPLILALDGTRYECRHSTFDVSDTTIKCNENLFQINRYETITYKKE